MRFDVRKKQNSPAPAAFFPALAQQALQQESGTT
jgi:hypothetical protein